MAKRPQSTAALRNQLQQIAQLGQTGKLAESATQCQQLLKRYPNYAPAWHLFSVICLQQGQAELALQQIQRALDLDPHQADFYSQAGVVHCNLGDLETGITCYQKALTLQPSAHIRFNLGLALQKAGRLTEAEQTYLNLIADHPTYAVAHQHLGNLYQQQAQPTVAIRYYQQALQHQPNATTWCNLGVALQTIGEIEQAQRAFQQALELDPNHLEAHNGLGAVYAKQEAATPAIQHYQQALTIQPNYLPALINLGHINLRLEKYSEAEAIYRQVLQLQPHNTQALDSLVKLLLATCRWSELSDFFPQWRQFQSAQGANSLASSRSPLNSLFLPCSAEEQQIIAQNYAQLIQQRMNGVRAQLENYLENHQQTDQDKHKKIYLGYVSGDFRYHAVGQLILRLFELHDREKFVIFAYSFGPDDGSSERQKFVRDCDYFRDMEGYTPVTAARQVVQDKIDILIDLAGYTNYACSDLFALRPAPLQISYLGYPGTTGASYIDYVITDAVITPPKLESTLTEACLYLPETYQLNCYPYPAIDDIEFQIHSPALIAEDTARVQARSQNGLPVDAFVFCCFNKSQKLEPTMFAVWMRILEQVPNSVLWLLGEQPLAEQNLRSYAANHGIDPNRLIFAPRVHKAEHLLRHQCADLFLDTLYYNAHVTASDALWSGTPLITVIGNTFASRVAASLLTAAGIPELITPDLATYEQLAVELATNPAKLQSIKQRLLKNRDEYPLFNTTRMVRHLEAGYELIWQRYQTGLEPAAVKVAAPGETEVKNQPKEQPAKAHSPISNSPAFQTQHHPSSSSVTELKISETITCTADAGFLNWLRQINGSLLITTYQAGRVLLVGWNGEQVTLVAREFSKPMGAALAGERLALTTKHQLIFFGNAQALTYSYLEAQPGRYDALYLPRAAYYTGDLHTHDLAFGSDGLWLVNTRFSCLAHVSLDFSFTPRWYPSFISELVPEDRCHLNGLAMANGKPQYVTALGESDTVGGWRANKAAGGIVIDVNTDEIVLRGLSMPHSPRCYQNKLWLLNSGTGELWCVDPANWQPEVVCALPGFGRGLSLVGNYALVGLCQIREQQIFGGLPIQDRFEQLICGVAVVDLRQGQPIGFLRFPSGCRELYDVKFLPGVQRPNLLEPDHPATQEGFTAPEFAYWLRPSSQIQSDN
jgi:uncharacterized protein (TIGR03032 family)